MSIEIFVPGVGQYDNIGDIILRRQLLDWLRPLGRLHVYVGRAPDGYAGGLRLSNDDIVYASFGQWYRASLRTALRGRARYVFKPGEIQLTVTGMKEHVGMLPVLAAVRARGGRVARVGVGARNFARLPRLLMRPSIALSSISAWRDQRTADYLGGSTMPDLAFGEGTADIASIDSVRDTVVVSMRSDRPYPTDEWIRAVREFSARSDLSICVVTQVVRDSERSRQLASDLGGSILDWDGTGHHDQEAMLRAMYRRATVALSDRLHVLIAAYTEGAIPAAPLVDASDKIDRHFVAGGISGISFPTAGLSADDIVDAISAIVARRNGILTALGRTRERLAEVRADVSAALAAPVLERARAGASEPG